jgi:rhodanese-related sulfurtransferase
MFFCLPVAVLAVSKAEFSEVYNVDGGIHAYATQVNPAVGIY